MTWSYSALFSGIWDSDSWLSRYNIEDIWIYQLYLPTTVLPESAGVNATSLWSQDPGCLVKLLEIVPFKLSEFLLTFFLKCISRSRLIGCGDVTSKFLLMKCSWILPVIFHYYVSGLIKIFVIIKLYFTPFVMVFSPLSPSPMKYIILNRNGTILCLNYCLAVNRDLLYRMNPQLSLIGPVPLDITAHYYYFF